MKPTLSYLEYQRLELVVPPFTSGSSTISAKLKRLWQFFVSKSEPHVWSTRDRLGNIWWSARDPVTGRAINHVSEAEMRVWIERRHH